MTITDSRFLLCSATLGGGALSIWLAAVSVTRTLFFANRALATSAGGAIQVKGGAGDPYCAGQGALGCSGSRLVVDGSRFISNSAGQGGAIYAFSQYANIDVAITDSSFLGNSAEGMGGAAAFWGGRSLRLSSSSLENNTAGTSCGALAVLGSPQSVRVSDASITGNRAAGGDGGAMCMIAPESTQHFTCLAGQTLALSGQQGDISVVYGQQMPISNAFTCKWLLTPPGPGCHMEVTVVSVEVVPQISSALPAEMFSYETRGWGNEYYFETCYALECANRTFWTASNETILLTYSWDTFGGGARRAQRGRVAERQQPAAACAGESRLCGVWH